MQNIEMHGKTWYTLWRLFKLAELHEVMRQRGDSDLIDLINKVHTGTVEKHEENVLKSQFILPS